MAALLGLTESGSFSRTHALVEKLSKYKKFSLNEVKLLFSAALENSQVRGIATDYDVCDLLLHASSLHKKDLDTECKELIVKLEQSVSDRD